MKKFLRIGCFGLGWFFLASTWAGQSQAWTPQEIIRGIQDRYRHIRDLQADFHQRTILPVMDREKEASGRLYLKIPGKMRWDYLEGQRKTVIINDRMLWFYEPDEQQVTVSDLDRVADSDKLLTFLTGMGDLARDFQVDPNTPQEGIQGGLVALVLFPKQRSSQWTRLRLLLDPKNFQVVQTAFVGIQGDRTVIDYTHIRTNVGLDDDLFEFVVPEGVDVLHYPPKEEGR